MYNRCTTDPALINAPSLAAWTLPDRSRRFVQLPAYNPRVKRAQYLPGRIAHSIVASYAKSREFDPSLSVWVYYLYLNIIYVFWLLSVICNTIAKATYTLNNKMLCEFNGYFLSLFFKHATLTFIQIQTLDFRTFFYHPILWFSIGCFYRHRKVHSYKLHLTCHI